MRCYITQWVGLVNYSVSCLSINCATKRLYVAVNGEIKCRVWDHLVKGWIGEQYDGMWGQLGDEQFCETVAVWSIANYKGQLQFGDHFNWMWSISQFLFEHFLLRILCTMYEDLTHNRNILLLVRSGRYT